MRDIFNVFFGFGDRSGKVYNLVSTHDTFAATKNPYHATTTAVNDKKEANRESESLSTILVIDRLFKGKLSQKENQTKSESNERRIRRAGYGHDRFTRRSFKMSEERLRPPPPKTNNKNYFHFIEKTGKCLKRALDGQYY